MRPLLSLLLLFLSTVAVWAGPGDYFSNAGPVYATQPRGSLAAGALWRVVAAKGVVGRRGPGFEHPVVRRFAAGTVLQADIGRGGSDEVLLNYKDSQGRPWMKVRTRDGQDLDCFVRANDRYIRPVTR